MTDLERSLGYNRALKSREAGEEPARSNDVCSSSTSAALHRVKPRLCTTRGQGNRQRWWSREARTQDCGPESGASTFGSHVGIAGSSVVRADLQRRSARYHPAAIRKASPLTRPGKTAWPGLRGGAALEGI